MTKFAVTAAIIVIGLVSATTSSIAQSARAVKYNVVIGCEGRIWNMTLAVIDYNNNDEIKDHEIIWINGPAGVRSDTIIVKPSENTMQFETQDNTKCSGGIKLIS